MKAMVIQQYGGPEVLTPADLSVPQPAAGEVRVKVYAASVNPVDYKRRMSWPSQPLPVVLGWDVSGVVDALGEGVTDFGIGDTVYGMIRFPEEGRAYAEYVVAAATELALKPESLSHTEAAAMTLAPLTAHQAFETMGLKAGQTILIHAAAGGVGHYAVQLAKARGARVIGTASSRNKDFVLGLGSDEFVDYHERPFEEQVAEVDAVFDCVGGDTLPRSFGVIKKGGWLVSIASKPLSEQAEQHGIQAAWIWVVPSRADLDYLTSLVVSGKLRSHVSQTYPLEKVADAHRALETGRTVGKIVLEVG